MSNVESGKEVKDILSTISFIPNLETAPKAPPPTYKKFNIMIFLKTNQIINSQIIFIFYLQCISLIKSIAIS